MGRRTVVVRGGMFEVDLSEEGQGPPLVYLHGIWDGPDNPLLAALRQRFTVLEPKIPGFGATTGEEHLRDIHDATYFFLDLLDELGCDGVPLVGHCLGGMFAAELAAAQPRRFRSVVLIAPFGMWSDARPSLDFFPAPPDELALALYGPAGPDGIAGTSVLRPGSSEPEGLTDEQRLERRLERARALAGAARFLWPIPNRGLAKRAHRLPASTLLVWGTEDGLVPAEHGAMLQGLAEGSRLALVEGAGHLPHYQQPERVLTLVEEALAE
ncbi:MAG: alpha/beta hydrolase [Acidimicrobiales bacterium]|nr:alpha/beta hydrolase [Acidimicrobiales bacterium]